MKAPNIVLVGQPNAGKSTLFNVLADAHVASSNFSGTTVEVAESDILVNGRTVHVIDLPGAYSLNAGDEAEKVTLRWLLENDVDLVINVIDCTQLARSLELTVELGELGLPMIVALNQQDEAERKSIEIRPERLASRLGVPVVVLSARLGKGVKTLTDTFASVWRNPPACATRLEYTSHIEKRIREIENNLDDRLQPHVGCHRFMAIKALENPALLPRELAAALGPELAATRAEIESLHNRDGYETIAQERHHLAMKLAEESSRFVPRNQIPRRENLDRYLLHPVFGQMFLVGFFLTFFAVIFVIGNLFNRLISTGLDRVPSIYTGIRPHSLFLWYTLDGLWQGIAGTLGIVLPYFIPLILLTALFEDTGYLARIAFLMDGLLHRIGLHGKSVAAFVTGLGCTAPALYATRILENRRDRVLSALLLPFIPCSARHAVIFALTAAFTGPLWAIVIYATTLLVIGLAGKGLAFFLPRPTGLIMEIPDLKMPSLRVALAKTGIRLDEFVRHVAPWLLAGSVIMAWLGWLRLETLPDRLLGPLLETGLGLPPQLGGPLLFGFFRKELVLVMAVRALGGGTLAAMPLQPEQVIVFLLFVTLYFPCLSTFVAMCREFGARVAMGSAVLSLVVAFATAGFFRLLFVLF